MKKMIRKTKNVKASGKARPTTTVCVVRIPGRAVPMVTVQLGSGISLRVPKSLAIDLYDRLRAVVHPKLIKLRAARRAQRARRSRA